MTETNSKQRKESGVQFSFGDTSSVDTADVVKFQKFFLHSSVTQQALKVCV